MEFSTSCHYISFSYGSHPQVLLPSHANRGLTNVRVTVGLKLSPSDTVIDLGCGDGRWLIHMASCSSCQCWGVEIDSNRLRITGERINEENLRSLIELIQVDLYAMNLSKFSVVIVYLSREGNENLKEKILQECSCHTSIIAVGVSPNPP
jgi:ubiquinone/menaquinone biosynthesis C-methylase UbiE